MPDLTGVSVVVTRAPHQSAELCDLIEDAGGEAIRFPVTKIEPLSDEDPDVTHGLDQLSQTDIAIFVSPNAVTFGFALLARTGAALPESAKVLAVGPGTARQLAKKGLQVDGVPQQRYDTEALLALPALQSVRDVRVLVVRGLAGRETLAEALAGRGAKVMHLPCYRRVRPDQVDATVLAHWRKSGFDSLILTSTSAADHLWFILGDEVGVLTANTALVVASERIAGHCRSLGFTGTIVLADNAGMPALVNALSQWQSDRPRQ